MKKYQTCIHLLLLLITPFSLVHPEEIFLPLSNQFVSKVVSWEPPETYDEILELIKEIELDDFEKRYSEKDLQKITDFLIFLARQGILPGEEEKAAELEGDIEELFLEKEYQPAYFSEGSHKLCIEPAILYPEARPSIELVGKISKSWKSTKKFVKKHKKAVIIGIVVIVVVVSIGVGVAVASSSAAAAAAIVDSETSKPVVSNPSSNSSEPPLKDICTAREEMEETAYSFKEQLVSAKTFSSNQEGSELPPEETARIMGAVFAHEILELFQEHNKNPEFFYENRKTSMEDSFEEKETAKDLAHLEVDRRFSTEYGKTFSETNQGFNYSVLEKRGDLARSKGYYFQAIHDFSEAIEINPENPELYLRRGNTYFDMGHYDHSLEDFKRFTDINRDLSRKIPLSLSQFTVGFAKGLPKGVYESGEGILLFLTDFVVHPVHTSKQVIESFSALVDLVKNDEWGLIGESLSPEVSQLIKEWDILPSDKRGELAGYAIGKHGADILIPGTLAKVASKSVKKAKQLSTVCKNIKKAEEMLLLETAVEMGSTKVGEVINLGKANRFIGEELGFTSREIGHLKQAGKLEGAIDGACESLLAKSPSEAYISAKNGGKHARLIEFEQRSVKEVQKSIKSLEKQIAKHQDKIANPSKYCPGWDKMDSRRKNALINKKWPSEIQCFAEEKGILQTVLEQMIEN